LTGHFAIDKFTLIPSSIGPCHLTVSHYIIFLEFSLINFATISEKVCSLSLKLSVGEITLIVIAIEFESTFSSFFTLDELSFVLDGAIVPGFGTHAMVDVVEPLTLVHRAIGIDKGSLAISFSTFPLTLVDVSVGVCHATFAFKETCFSLSLVHAAVSELDGTETFPNGLVLVLGPDRKMY
jgi:hypothetical protein